MTSVQLVVVGAGPGGYAAAFLAADLGLSVALVDPEAESGRRLRLSRLHSVEGAAARRRICSDESRHAKAWGIEFGEPTIDLDKLRAFKDNVVKQLTGGTGAAGQDAQDSLPPGLGRDRRRAPPDGEADRPGGEEQVQFEHALLATGSTPAIPPIAEDRRPARDGLDRRARSARHPEVAARRRRRLHRPRARHPSTPTLGSAVTVVEMTPGLLPGADRDLVDVLAKRVATDDEERAARDEGRRR